MQQNEAFDLLKMGKNIFLTGAAGAGKTYLLNQYIEYLQSHGVSAAVTASTGIAATHLQGKTIHSWSGIGIRNSISEEELEKLLRNSRIKRNYKKTKVLIIDEISMLHGFQLDMIDTIARYILGSDKPFGGIQVVVCGDFFQLPPVSSGSMDSEKIFAFESKSWQSGGFHICYLHEQHRQGDDPLLTVLNDIRSGNAGEHTKIPLRTRYKRDPETGGRATKLYSRNINVDGINNRELAKITGEEKLFTMETIGFSALVEGLKKSCLALAELKLKVGAEVMFIKNSVLGLYVNGTRGVVVGFDKKGWPLVRIFSGNLISAGPEDWKYEDNGVVRATIIQVPLRLAWAITIHKSQGMTLDAAEIDLGDAFEPGMGYVALSRVRSLSGLKLMNLNEMALQVHPKILVQDQSFKDASKEACEYLEGFSGEAKDECHKIMLTGRMAGSTTKLKKGEKIKKIPAHMITMGMLKDRLSVTIMAEKRELKAGTIITHLEKLKGAREIDNSDLEYIREMFSTQDFDSMFNMLQKSDDGKLKPVYDEFDGKYSYDDIKAVRLFVN